MRGHGRLGAVLAAVWLLAGCGRGGGPTADPAGTWWATHVDGEAIAVGIDTAEIPWVTFGDHVVRGSLGCNGFGAAFEFDGATLEPDGFDSTASLCTTVDGGDEVMRSEQVLTDMLIGDIGVAFDAARSTMTWSASGHIVVFESADGEPPIPTSPPPASFGLLDCSPGVVVETRRAADGVVPEELAIEAAPEVRRVEPGERLIWWGSDADGAVVVAIALGDVPGAEYQIFTCAD